MYYYHQPIITPPIHSSSFPSSHYQSYMHSYQGGLQPQQFYQYQQQQHQQQQQRKRSRNEYEQQEEDHDEVMEDDDDRELPQAKRPRIVTSNDANNIVQTNKDSTSTAPGFVLNLGRHSNPQVIYQHNTNLLNSYSVQQQEYLRRKQFQLQQQQLSERKQEEEEEDEEQNEMMNQEVVYKNINSILHDLHVQKMTRTRNV
jgi:NACalpha-BTF3-like transcription factor